MDAPAPAESSPAAASPAPEMPAPLRLDRTDWVALALGVVLVHLCLWLSMRFAGAIHRVLKDSGTMLVSRIAGLLLAAIAVQLLADAVLTFAREV